ncbi:unnamed protein product [Rotaria sp. Silwood1]|nr:unnamed protein product [Rotaria sp. Silwood1]CAF3412561.1 unnamed protein product [Rotaria sp. Silwood1]CAF3438395.1 unnamed protein product [Rotaria sp. Silwood1]CAF3440051.1 unnamed protein product [Rotaria sp. Silwood1]CAF3442814.1 unnamed protein product [Rotaria sp. Silwood1]
MLLGDTSERQKKQQKEQLLQNTPRRPISNDSTQSMDNAYSLEHLFIALRRRIRRIVQTYNIKAFYDALKICARIFQSYASYNLNTIDEFARRLSKNARDNKKVLTIIDQFRLQLAELRHCHSTFEAELLVTTLAIDFHEDESEHQHQQQQQPTDLPLSTGKFSPRSRVSKFRVRHIRQATELKTQLKRTNEQLQVLLLDEFYANVSNLWDESDKYISTSIPFHDHHMTYVLRLIPDIVLKFEYALQLCTKLFDLETTMIESYPQTNRYIDNNHNTTTTNNNNNNNTNNNNINIKTFNDSTSVTMLPITPYLDNNQQQEQEEIPVEDDYQKMKSNKNNKRPSAFFSADVTSASSNSSNIKLSHPIKSPIISMHREEPLDIISQHDDNPIFPPLFTSSEKSLDYKNDQNKLQLLIEQLEKRLIDEELYRKRLLNCVKLTTKKSEQLNHFPKNNMLTFVMSDEPGVVEYQKGLCLSDCQIHKSVSDELNIAIREIQHRIDWINMVRQRALQCLGE